MAVICLSGSRSKYWRLFIPYLFIICVVELYAAYLRDMGHNNQWPYNILFVFQVSFNSFLFMKLFSQYFKARSIIIIGAVILTLVYIWGLITLGVMFYSRNTYTTMCVLFMLYSFYYFYLFMKDPNYVVIGKSPEFWLVVGTLLFYFASTVVNIFRGKLSDIHLGDYSLTRYINNVLSMILYGCWSYSFICKRWLTTKSGTWSLLLPLFFW